MGEVEEAVEVAIVQRQLALAVHQVWSLVVVAEVGVQRIPVVVVVAEVGVQRIPVAAVVVVVSLQTILVVVVAAEEEQE